MHMICAMALEADAVITGRESHSNVSGATKNKLMTPGAHACIFTPSVNKLASTSFHSRTDPDPVFARPR